MLEQIALQGTEKGKSNEGDTLLTLWTESEEDAKKLAQQLEAKQEEYGAYKILVYKKFVEIAPPTIEQTERLYKDYKDRAFPQIREITTTENRVYLD